MFSQIIPDPTFVASLFSWQKKVISGLTMKKNEFWEVVSCQTDFWFIRIKLIRLLACFVFEPSHSFRAYLVWNCVSLIHYIYDFLIGQNFRTSVIFFWHICTKGVHFSSRATLPRKKECRSKITTKNLVTFIKTIKLKIRWTIAGL